MPPTLRTAILGSLEIVDEISADRLRNAVADYRSEHTSPWLRRFAHVSPTSFQLTIGDLVRAGDVAERARLTDQGRVWFYRLVRQWPATTESMGHAAARMGSAHYAR